MATSNIPSPDRPHATDGPADSRRFTSQQAQHGQPWAWRPRAWSDVLISSGLVVIAAAIALTLPSGSTLRAVLTLPVLLVAPGYLLLQSILVPARPPSRRLLHAVLGLGISPPLVGLLALSTTVVPGIFTPNTIIAAVTLGCLALGTLAVFRRERHRAQDPGQATAGDPSPE